MDQKSFSKYAAAWPRVAELCAKVVELNPFMVGCRYDHAVAGLRLGRLEAAETSAAWEQKGLIQARDSARAPSR